MTSKRWAILLALAASFLAGLETPATPNQFGTLLLALSVLFAVGDADT